MPSYLQKTSVTMPYPGLRPFRRDESEVFFGREEHVAKLGTMLQHHHFVAVVGPSGCGKSSLVTAGLLPQLVDGFLLDIEGGWRVATVQPGDHPITRLAEALVNNDMVPGRVEQYADDVSRVGFLDASLRRGPLGLIELLEGDRARDENVLLVIDQFEEIFRFHQEKSAQEADAFVAMLLTTATQADKRKLPIYIMLTMRSDYLGDCGQFAGLPEAISASQFLTPRLTREQRHAAIVGPAVMFDGEVEPALVNRLLNDMGDDPDQLPIMQHALMRMWSRVAEFHDRPEETEDGLADHAEQIALTTEVYDDVGGWEDTLSNHADEAFNELANKTQRHVAEMLFRCLTQQRQGGSAIRRPVSVEEVAAVAGPDMTTAMVKEVVQVFRHSDQHPDRSFVTPPTEVKKELRDDDILDISHESLIRQWKRLHDEWTAREADSAEKYQSLLSTARRWKNEFNEGENALWGTPNLEFTLDWWKKAKPSAAWAKRYGGDYELAKIFLDKSRIKQERDRRQEEATRQHQLEEAKKRADEKEREAKKLRFLTLGLAVSLVVVCVAVVVAYGLKRGADRSRAEAEIRERVRIAGLDCQEGYISEGVSGFIACQATGEKLADGHPLKSSLQRLAESWNDSVSRVISQESKEISTKISAVSVNRDGTKFATASDTTVRLWDLAGNQLGVPLEHDDAISAVIFSRDGNMVVTASFDHTARVWDSSTGEAICDPLQHEWPVYFADCSPDGSKVVTVSYDESARLWNVETGDLHGSPLVHGDVVNYAAFSEDGTRLATASSDNTARVWNIATSKELASFLHPEPVITVAFDPDGDHVLTTTYQTAYVWGLADSKPKELSHEGPINSARFSRDGRLVVTASSDRSARVWNAATGSAVGTPLPHAEEVSSALFGPDGRNLITTSYNTVTLWGWDGREASPLGPVLRHSDQVQFSAFKQDDHSILTADDSEVRLWSPLRHASDNQWEYTGLEAGFGQTSTFSVAFHRDTCVAGDQESIRFWDRFSDPPDTADVQFDDERIVTAIAISPDCSKLVTASQQGRRHEIQTFSLDPKNKNAKQTSVHSIKIETIAALAISPDFKKIVTGSGRRALFWDADSGQTLGIEPLTHRGNVVAVAFGPKGEKVVTGSEDKYARVWHISRENPGQPVRLRHESTVRAVAFSPDGRTLATGSQDGTARLWDVESGQPLGRPLLNDGAVIAVGFASDGETVATVNESKTIRLWNVPYK